MYSEYTNGITIRVLLKDGTVKYLENGTIWRQPYDETYYSYQVWEAHGNSTISLQNMPQKTGQL